MRSYRIVLTMAALLMPTMLHAQATEPAPVQPAAASADEPTSKQTTRTSPAQKSLMGMVMGALIASAEQSARTRSAAEAQSRKVPPQGVVASEAPSASARPTETGQVAVQSEP